MIAFDVGLGFRRLLVAISTLALLAAPALAQRADTTWRSASTTPAFNVGSLLPVWTVGQRTIVPDSSRIPRTHWLEVGAVAGGVGGILGGVLAVQLCGYERVCPRPALAALSGFFVLGVVTFGLGALIGGQFPKS